jgi:hypothetical protein
VQSRGLRFGLFQDGDVGVGVFPDGHKQERPQTEVTLLLAVALDKLLEARVRAQGREIWVGINGGKIAVSGVECFLQRVQSLFFIVAGSEGRTQLKKYNGRALLFQEKGKRPVVVPLTQIYLRQPYIWASRTAIQFLGVLQSYDRLGKSFLEEKGTAKFIVGTR